MTSLPILPVSRRHLLAGAGASVLVAGCSGTLIGPLPASQLYLLKPQMGAVSDAPKVTWALEVATPSAPASLNTDRIALSNASLTMDYYANAAWPEQLPQSLHNLLIEAFEESGKIASVSKDGANVHADFLLQIDVRDFEAQYAVADTAPKILLRMEAKLIRNRQIVSSLDASQEAQAATNSVPSVVAAFNQALGAALSQIVTWTLRTGG